MSEFFGTVFYSAVLENYWNYHAFILFFFFDLIPQGLWNVESDGDESNGGCILRVYVNVAFSKKTMWKGVPLQIFICFVLFVCGLWSFIMLDNNRSLNFTYWNLNYFHIWGFLLPITYTLLVHVGRIIMMHSKVLYNQEFSYWWAHVAVIM